MNVKNATTGQRYRITQLSGQPQLLNRLISLGFIRGSALHVMEKSIFDQTYAVLVDDNQVALRAEEAALILIEPWSDA